jgi:hypothetical protein
MNKYHGFETIEEMLIGVFAPYYFLRSCKEVMPL